MSRKWKVIAGVGLAALILFSLVMNFWLAPQIFFEQKDAAREGVSDTMEWENAAENYRWFRQQWHDIQAARDKLENLKEDERRFHNQTWPDDGWRDHRDARNRHSRLHDRITGMENTIENYVAEYNARSDDATRAIFQCGLPYNVDEKLYIADATGVEYTSNDAVNRTAPEDPAKCQYMNPPEESEG